MNYTLPFIRNKSPNSFNINQNAIFSRRSQSAQDLDLKSTIILMPQIGHTEKILHPIGRLAYFIKMTLNFNQ